MTYIVDKFILKYGRLPTEFDSDYLEMLRMSKYRILDTPDFSPGKCANCGGSKNDGRKYVDFGLEVSWYGTVYLCGNCLSDLAKEMGLYTALEEKVKAAEDEILKLQGLSDKGADLQGILLKTFEEVKQHYDNLHSSGNDSISDSSTVVDDVVSSTSEGSEESKSRITKSTSVSRSKNLPSLADLLESSS